MKKCVKCKLQLNASEFHKDMSRSDGLYPYCKDCRRIVSGNKKRRTSVWGLDKTGYIKKGSIWQHRFIMEQKLGRELTSLEEVHHLDNNKTNNSPSNLVLCASHAEHMRVYHQLKIRNGIELKCTGCGKLKYHPLSKLLRSSKKNYRCYDCWRGHATILAKSI